MKVIIAGSRGVLDFDEIKIAMLLFLMENGIETSDVSEIVSGACYGADKLGELWAQRKDIPVKLFPAKWKEYGMKAGPIRNAVMANYADALVAVWDGKSRGTKNMISEAKKKGLVIYIYETA